MIKYLFDTSVLILLSQHHGRWKEAEKIFEQGSVYVCFASVTEFYYYHRPYRSEDLLKRYENFYQLPFSIIWPNRELLDKAGYVKAEYALGLGDAFVAAAAEMHECVLVHRDKDFLKMKDIRQIYLGKKKHGRNSS